MAKKNCPHCGAAMVEYKHNLSKGQVGPLIKLFEAGGGPVSITDDLHLIIGEYTNFAKLAYWGLARQQGGSERGGVWEITEKGRQFVQGDITLPRTVWVYRGDVQRFEGGNISIHKVSGGWKFKPQYAAEAQAAGDKLCQA